MNTHMYGNTILKSKLNISQSVNYVLACANYQHIEKQIEFVE